MRGVILMPNDDTRELLTTYIRSRHGDTTVVDPPPYGDAGALRELVTSDIDFVILPLTLPSAHSLLVARLAHQGSSRARLVLVTASSADPGVLRGLFDTVLSAPPDLAGLMTAITADGRVAPDRIASESVLDERTEEIINNAGCFDARGEGTRLLDEFKRMWREELRS
jgi:DNA-binding response OmpR family regulator